MPPKTADGVTDGIIGAEKALILPADGAIGAADATMPTILPERARKTALARADLVRLYREAGRRAARGKQVQACADFLAAYNLGAWPQLYAQLHGVSKSTIERWKRDWETSGDPLSLAPKWGEHWRKGRREITLPGGVVHRYSQDITVVEAGCLIAYALHENALPIAEAVRAARAKLAANGLPLGRSGDTYRRFLEDFRDRHFDLWVYFREGGKAHNDKCIPYLIRDYGRLQVGDCLVADGHTFNATIVNPWTGQPVRMTLIQWYEMKSNYPLGWDLMPTENTQAIAAALRRAILRLGFAPRCVYLDNGKAFGAKFFSGRLPESGLGGLFERLGITPIFARPYHAQSKTVERFFGSFAELERRFPTYVGTSIENKPAYLKRGEKLHRRLHRKMTGGFVPDLEQAHRAIAAWIDEYAERRQGSESHIAGLRPIEVFEGGLSGLEDISERQVDPELLPLLMLAVEHKQIKRGQVRMPGQRFYRHPQLYGRNHTVLVRYDLQDPNFILVYETTGEFICEALLETGVHPIARVTGTEADRAELAEKLANQQRLLKQTTGAARRFAEEMVVPETRKLLEDQGLGVRGQGPGTTGDRGPETGKGKAQILKLPSTQDLETAERRQEADEALAAAGFWRRLRELPERERYERLLELEVQGREIPEEDLAFMRYFEQTETYQMLGEYYEERRLIFSLGG